MKYKYLVTALLLSILAAPAAAAETNESFQFRGVDWGLSMTDLIDVVIKNEYKNGLEEDDYTVEIDKFVIFSTTVGGLKCEADYFLVDGKFADGAYFLTEDHSNIEQYYSDYTTLVEKYTKKYGEPVVDSKKWIGDSIYKDKPDSYGMAVGIGDLQRVTRWEAEDGSLIEFFMTGDNYDITTRIDYLCPGYYDLDGLSSGDEGI